MRDNRSWELGALCASFRPDLDKAVAELGTILDESEEREGPWAYQVNWFSRRIHIGLWQACPEDKYVTDTIIPMLERAHELLRSTPPSGDHGENVPHYAGCVLFRLTNAERYLRGEGPLVPKDKP